MTEESEEKGELRLKKKKTEEDDNNNITNDNKNNNKKKKEKKKRKKKKKEEVGCSLAHETFFTRMPRESNTVGDSGLCCCVHVTSSELSD